MSTLSTILAAVLGAVFLAAGIPKVTGQEKMVANFKRWGYADVIRLATGWLEILTATMLLVGIAVPVLAVAGSLIVIAIMIGALFTHQHARDPIAMCAPPVILLVLDLVLAYSLLP